jgi:5-methylcytosine-specific restriction enzyme A
MLRWSGNPPTSGPGSWASVMGSMGAPPAASAVAGPSPTATAAHRVPPRYAPGQPSAGASGDPHPAPPCLGCGRQVRGRPRCRDCQASADQAKWVRRPDLHNDARERERRRRVVADHRAIAGDWCPGWERRPAHPSADLTADHIREVARGGPPDGRLVVRCRSCNAARSAHLAHRILRTLTPNDPSPAEQPITDTAGPVVA